ncbi:hypothetical protein KRR38_16465 [Novosphingobium sp. G106]|nr:hypothetical protein [Novosphingobium sp. G106]
MTNNAAYYRDLAARAQTEADEATLDNVRDRALRSAAAFETMALQHERTAKRRIERENAADSNAAYQSTNGSITEHH